MHFRLSEIEAEFSRLSRAAEESRIQMKEEYDKKIDRLQTERDNIAIEAEQLQAKYVLYGVQVSLVTVFESGNLLNWSHSRSTSR